MRGGFAGRIRVMTGKPALPRGGAWFQLWPAQLYGKSRKVGFYPRASAVADRCGGPNGLCADAEPVGVAGQFAGRRWRRQQGGGAAAERAGAFPGEFSISLAAGGLAGSGPESFCGCLRRIDTGVIGAIGGAPAARSDTRTTATGTRRVLPVEHSDGLGAAAVRRADLRAATEFLGTRFGGDRRNARPVLVCLYHPMPARISHRPARK